MMKPKFYSIWIMVVVLILGGFLVSCTRDYVPTFKYLGQNPPGMTPEVFAPNLISAQGKAECDPAFTPDGKTFYYCDQAVYRVMRWQEGEWSAPETASFSGTYPDYEACITRDDQRLFFISRRPPEDWETYVVERNPAGGWGEPRLAGEHIRGGFYPSVAMDGTLFVTAHWNGGKGPFHIHKSEWVDGAFGPLEKLEGGVNAFPGTFEAAVSQDERFIVFCAMDSAGCGGIDLYVSFKSEGEPWGEARNLGATINSTANDARPSLSHDGRLLFFTSDRNGDNDIFWVDAKVIDDLYDD